MSECPIACVARRQEADASRARARSRARRPAGRASPEPTGRDPRHLPTGHDSVPRASTDTRVTTGHDP